ncbi:MAG: DUF3226 domain-containing protein [Burkholderiales bacterium]
MNNNNVLLVEGKDDLYAIAELMGHYTPWSQRKESAPVKIKDLEGVEKLLDRALISAELKSHNLKNIGVVIDANDTFQTRWDTLKRLFITEFPDIPNALPTNGLICQNSDGQQLGIWIMPNNSSPGMLETFLSTFITEDDAQKAIWQHAINANSHAKTLGAPYRDVHLHKAQIHTWLAWQDTPGDAFGTALVKKTLNPSSPSAAIFVEWFMQLFKLPARGFRETALTEGLNA